MVFGRSRSFASTPSESSDAAPFEERITTKPDSSSLATIEIERDPVVRFRAEAAARSTTVPRLVRDLLSVIATDKLTHAILDDD
jgi:hypothetical protein